MSRQMYWDEEAHQFFPVDDVPQEPVKPTNADRIRSMTDEELAEYLFDRGNGSEYCYGICSYQDKCKESHPQKFCIEHVVEWLNAEVEE